jgi:large subunit ribosomal protein L18
MAIKDKKVARRRKIQARVRKTISGSEAKPRLCVFRSNKEIYAQIIDDVNGKTLVSASTLEKELAVENGGNAEAAKIVGKAIGERAVKAGIENVVFDRAGYIYHGRVKELSEAAREAGLKF